MSMIDVRAERGGDENFAPVVSQSRCRFVSGLFSGIRPYNRQKQKPVTRRRRLDALTDRLARAIGPDGAVPFAPGAHPPQFNVWAAMFAEQALALAQFEPNALARFAAAPCIV